MLSFCGNVVFVCHASGYLSQSKNNDGCPSLIRDLPWNNERFTAAGPAVGRTRRAWLAPLPGSGGCRLPGGC